MRLEDGTDRSNGRVEICQYGIWGSVCSTEWDINDTIVVCRQLGFESEGMLYTNMHMHPLIREFYVLYIRCGS